MLSLAASRDGTIYLGTADGHVFASQDGGEHWELRGRAGGRMDGVVQRIVTDAGHRERVLAALWFRNAPGGGVFESSDGGRHWQSAGLQEAVRALEQAPSSPQVWVAGTRSGVFRSDDGGHSWQRITPADDPELQNVDSLAVDPRDAQTIYVGTYHLPWKTVDGGKNWSSIAEGMIDDSDIMSLRIDAKNPQRIFSSACSGIYRSEDGGAHWIKLQGIPYSSRRTQQIVQDPMDAQTLYAATTEGLWLTSDAGETWRRITPRGTDSSAVVLLPPVRGAAETKTRILAGFDAQGVLRSEDGGKSFVDSNAGFNHLVIRSAAANPADPRDVLILAESSPSLLFETPNAGETWSELNGLVSNRGVDRVFGTSGRWWAALSTGGLASYEPQRARWIDVPFREGARDPAKKVGAAKRGRYVQTVLPRVRAVAEIKGAIFVATGQGLWKMEANRAGFSRVITKNLPAALDSLIALKSGAFLAVAEGALWSTDEHGVAWQRLVAPDSDGAVLWARQFVLADRPRLFTARPDGLYEQDQDSQWRRIASGLPTIAPVTMDCSATTCLVAMSNGGLYRSEADASAWRLIGEEEIFLEAIFVDGRGGFNAASRSEGLLRVAGDHGRK